MRRGLVLVLFVLALGPGGCGVGGFQNPYYGNAYVAPAEPQPPAQAEQPQAQAEQPQPPQPEQPQAPEQPQPAVASTTSDITITHTVTRAPTYPSSPFVATYPTSRGGSDHVCKSFTRSTDNKNDCLVHCRGQLMSVGSCSCLELERCPEGIRTVD